jgi:hypothetical protein
MTTNASPRFSSFAAYALVLAIAASCSSSSPSPKPPPGLTCASPGEATPGPADAHCAGQSPQAVTAASCFVDAATTASQNDAVASANGGDGEAGAEDAGDEGGVDGGGGATSGDDACDYGATMFGGTRANDGGPEVTQGDDDDCKYHVAWTSTPICHSSLRVTFTVTVTSLVTGLPVTDIPATEGILPEAFIPTTLDAACDTLTTHPSPTSFGDAHLYETTPTSGVYVGGIAFDQPGEWTVRFHIHEECSDLLPDSPHGHAAFHITVP